MNGSNCFPCEFGRNVSRNHSQSEDLDVNCLASPLRGFQVFSAVLTHSEVELASSYGLFDCVVLAIQLVSNGCADEVGAV